MTPSSMMNERSTPIEIDTGQNVRALTFTANGEYLVSGDEKGVRVWGVKDGKQVARMETRDLVLSLAASKNGKWIAAGTEREMLVWNAGTYEQVLKHWEGDHVLSVDFSPDSTRLVATTNNCTAIVWDLVTGKQVQILRHVNAVIAAKYSPRGDRIATATAWSHVQVWDSNDGRLLVDIKVTLTPLFNLGLLWFNDHLFAVSDRKIKEFDASTGSKVSEWPVPNIDYCSCIALPKDEQFIASSTNRTVTFWDTSTHSQLDLIKHPKEIWSIALSPDDQFLASGGAGKKITIQCLSHIANIGSFLREWAKTTISENTPWKDALRAAPTSRFPRGTIYWVVCERLETTGRVTDAVKCFQEMSTELGGETNLYGEILEWARGFRQRSFDHLEHLGDTAANAQQYDEAISLYTTALSLTPSSPQDLLIKRGKAYMKVGSWQLTLDDANQVINLDPSSPWGYEMKHIALHETGDYDNAIRTFQDMLSRIEQSPNPDIRRRYRKYKTLSRIQAKIRKNVKRVIRDSPHMLINTTTGRLLNRDKRASEFESQPIFKELVSSMTTHIDRARIRYEVQQYFRYVVLSHKWEDNEPLFHHVVHIAVYDLNDSPTHNKLHTYCKIVRDAGFHWAWSDTCCIDQSDHFVLQEALVAMFKWYQGSALMIVFLRGVPSSSPRGALSGSIWNTRGWTLQEYIAAKKVQFYTEDWTLYRDLQLPNHKESSEVVAEMEQATGVSAQRLMSLRPGLTSIREKLRLASTRRTTRVEDAAYSLLGIFSAVGIPAIYGEGEASLGRLLANILTRSGEVSILAWTGEPSEFNSCLPARITVYNGTATSHVPAPIPEDEMQRIIAASHSSFDFDVALKLYDHLNGLPTPRFAESRMTLSCIAFLLPPFSQWRSGRVGSRRIYRVDTITFGRVEMKTRHDLSQMTSLYLVHPWLDALLECEDKSDDNVERDVPPPSPDIDNEEFSDSDSDDDEEGLSDREFWDDEELSDEDANDNSTSLPQSGLHPAPVHTPMDREMGARRLVVLLRQPFGALLMKPDARVGDYQRVATDSLIRVRFQEGVSLAGILDNVRTIEVL